MKTLSYLSRVLERSSFRLKVQLSFVWVVCVPMLVFAHDPGYQDFYNTKQGTMEADSGCRLLLCLGNPKGPMSEPACVQDVQSMYTEIALSATYWHGPAWVPQCTGLNGLNMGAQLNAAGKNAGTYVKHERFQVLRLTDDDDGSHWEVIYSSLRSPVFLPKTDSSTGLLSTSNTPTHTWNVEPKGMGKSKVIGYSPYGGSSFSSNETVVSRVTEGDISKNVIDSSIRLFEGRNYFNRSATEFEQAVISSDQTGIISSIPPRGSFFQRGDKIAILPVSQVDGNNPSARVKPNNQFTVRTTATVIGADGKPVQKVINNTVKLKFGTTNDGSGRMTQDISGFDIKANGGAGSSAATTSVRIVDGRAVYDRGTAKPANYSVNENTGVVSYEEADGTRVTKKGKDYAVSSTTVDGVTQHSFSYTNEHGGVSTFDPSSKIPVNSDTPITN